MEIYAGSHTRSGLIFGILIWYLSRLIAKIILIPNYSAGLHTMCLSRLSYVRVMSQTKLDHHFQTNNLLRICLHFQDDGSLWILLRSSDFISELMMIIYGFHSSCNSVWTYSYHHQFQIGAPDHLNFTFRCDLITKNNLI